MDITCFRDLTVWQKAMDYVVAVYELTRGFPKEEQYGLTSQLRRAAVSIPSNIAEGHGRQTTRDSLHFLSVAYGSLNETQTQIIIGLRLGFLDKAQCSRLQEMSNEVGRLLNGLSNSLKNKLA